MILGFMVSSADPVLKIFPLNYGSRAAEGPPFFGFYLVPPTPCVSPRKQMLLSLFSSLPTSFADLWVRLVSCF